MSGKRELAWFKIGDSYGGSQDWMTDKMMHLGGCGALAACDTCIYLSGMFDEYRDLYPFDRTHLTKEDYISFGNIMKPYLSPRMGGIDRPEIFIEGFKEYLSGFSAVIGMTPFEGERSLEEAEEAVRETIDKSLPIPVLTLRHRNPAFDFYEWHWYMLTGYEETEDDMLVKAVTFGDYKWLSLSGLWDSGHKKKGGFVIYDLI